MSHETLLNGRYRLIAQQGSGGMAVIYKAVDTFLSRTVAVKVLRPSLTTDAAFLERFRAEARSVANLNHQNIVTVFDFGNDQSAYYIVMEFVEGQDLKQMIRTAGALPPERAVRFAIQICAGIGFAHRAGLVHADIKPQNILVTREDEIKVTDFGIAQAFSDTYPNERQDVVWGSPHYFAPEQARGDKPGPASDVYAIGIVMFEMLTGRLPFMGTNQQELALAHIRDRVPLVSEYAPQVPEALVKIVEKVMSKEPSQRYSRADQLGHLLSSYLEKSGQATMQAPMPSPSAPPAGAPPPPNTIPNQRINAGQTVPNPAANIAPPPPNSLPGQSTPFNAQPTLRYNVAPEAPQYAPPRQPTQGAQGGQPLYNPPPQAPYGQPQQNYNAQPNYNMPMENPLPPLPNMSLTGNSRPLQAQEAMDEEQGGFDWVTWGLAGLAFMMMIGLMILYFLVLQARL
jgi:eukaryotic-like serine/threonine-protein kinase